MPYESLQSNMVCPFKPHFDFGIWNKTPKMGTNYYASSGSKCFINRTRIKQIKLFIIFQGLEPCLLDILPKDLQLKSWK